MHHIAFTLALLGLFTSSAQAQFRRAVPDALAVTYGRSSMGLPFNRTRSRFQVYTRGDQVQTKVILQIGYRVAYTAASSAAFSQVFEVKMGNTKLKMSTLSRVFASKFTSTSTVFSKMKKVSFPTKTGLLNRPELPFYWIRADRPFVFLGPNLIVQHDIRTAKTYRNSLGPRVDGFMGSASRGST